MGGDEQAERMQDEVSAGEAQMVKEQAEETAAVQPSVPATSTTRLPWRGGDRDVNPEECTASPDANARTHTPVGSTARAHEKPSVDDAPLACKRRNLLPALEQQQPMHQPQNQAHSADAWDIAACELERQCMQASLLQAHLLKRGVELGLIGFDHT